MILCLFGRHKLPLAIARHSKTQILSPYWDVTVWWLPRYVLLPKKAAIASTLSWWISRCLCRREYWFVDHYTVRIHCIVRFFLHEQRKEVHMIWCAIGLLTMLQTLIDNPWSFEAWPLVCHNMFAHDQAHDTVTQPHCNRNSPMPQVPFQLTTYFYWRMG